MESWKAKLLFPQKEHVSSWFGLLAKKTLSISLSGAGFPRCWCSLFPYAKQSNQGLKRTETSAKNHGSQSGQVIIFVPGKNHSWISHENWRCVPISALFCVDELIGLSEVSTVSTECWRKRSLQRTATEQQRLPVMQMWKKNLGLFHFHLVFGAFIPAGFL